MARAAHARHLQDVQISNMLRLSHICPARAIVLALAIYPFSPALCTVRRTNPRTLSSWPRRTYTQCTILYVTNGVVMHEHYICSLVIDRCISVMFRWWSTTHDIPLRLSLLQCARCKGLHIKSSRSTTYLSSGTPYRLHVAGVFDRALLHCVEQSSV